MKKPTSTQLKRSELSHDPLRRKLSHLVWVTPVVTSISLPTHAQTSVFSAEFPTSGSFCVAIPAGVTSLDVVVAGGGGGGGGGGNGGDFSSSDGGGSGSQQWRCGW